MAFFGNLEGTLQNVFSLGKGVKTVLIRTHNGILQGKNHGGTWANLIVPPAGGVVETKSADFNAVDGTVYIVTALATATLPVPVLNAQLTIKKFGSASVTVARNGSENIDGIAASFVMASSKQSATFISDGIDWFII